MSKALTGLYLRFETAGSLRDRADKVGATLSDLADLFIRNGLATVSDDALRKWVLSAGSIRGRNGGGLNKNEKTVYAAIERLRAENELTWRFGADDIAREAGLLMKAAFLALKGLQARGLVHGYELPETDRWGRPLKSIWSLKADYDAHVARPTTE